MGWLNSPEMFFAALETVAEVTDVYLLNPTSAFEIYPPMAGTYSLASSLTTSTYRLQYVDVYMDDLNCASQGNVDQQQRASELTLQALNENFPSIPSEVKDSVSLKKRRRATETGPRSKKSLVGLLTRKTVTYANLTNVWRY